MIPKHHDWNRQHRALYGEKRRQAVAECHKLLEAIDEVDRQLAALGARRRELVRELKRRRSLLIPTTHRPSRARQPVPDGSVRLPPRQNPSTPLWGRRLRGTCLAVLRRTGPLALPELHALLHHHGFHVQSGDAVKALSDALAYEAERGRARRIERGVYAVTGDRPTSLERSSPGSRLEHLPETISPQAA